MNVHACCRVLLLFLLPCVSASGVMDRVHRHRGGDEELLLPSVGAPKRAIRRAEYARPEIAKGPQMMALPSPPAPVVTPTETGELAPSPDGTMHKSKDLSEHGTSDDEAQAWNLMAVAAEALSGQQFIAALCFALAAAGILDNVDAASAELLSDALSQQVDAAAAVASASVFENVEVASAGLLPDALSQKVDAAAAVASASSVDWGPILEKASKKALGGGKAGASAAIVQVISLMWLRTAMNYQYRYGGDLNQTLRLLYNEGGLRRLYRGLPFALVQGPLARFGDTASNAGILALLDGIPEAAGLPLPVKTAAASLTSGLWRILCMPIDTSKTALQVEGAVGFERLKQRVSEQGPAPLYQGAFATAGATIAGNYPWFLTYNFLDGQLPPVSKEEVLVSLIRAALLGVSASCVSDTVSNSFRVVKTTQQTALLKAPVPPARRAKAPLRSNSKDPESISIAEALGVVLETDGIKGLFGRGLKTRLLTNAIQGGLFSVLWKYFQTTGGMQ